MVETGLVEGEISKDEFDNSDDMIESVGDGTDGNTYDDGASEDVDDIDDGEGYF